MFKPILKRFSTNTSNPLTKLLQTSIKLHGPISVHDYMNLCLLHPQYGYYTQKDVFGKKGDFITSPEVSQMFGELMAIWYTQYWQTKATEKNLNRLQEQQNKFQLVELGPGRGTLMSDMLSTLDQFQFIYRNLERVCLIEPSPFMRSLQSSKLEPFTKKGLKIDWFDGVEDIPDSYSFWMAHEVFDAMPVYLFQQTEQGWRELVVDILEESSVNFQLGISKKKTKPLLLVEEKKGEVGDIIQISPQTNDTAVYIANHINKNGGAGLFIDYGDVEIKRNTLRGIKNHEFVSVFEDPGNVDLSVDVEFGAIKKAIESKSVHVFGPLDQGVFLKRMGIEARVLSLISKNGKEARAELTSQYERLVRGEMGKVYKVQAIADSSKTPYPFDIQ